MATGRGTQLTRQIGEHLVAAELGRVGYIAAPFAGNVPLYDLMAADSQGHAMPIQVKAINGGSWQYSADTFLNIEVENGQQVVKGTKKLPNPNLICIFVLLKGRGKDEFYLFRLSDLQEYTARIYKGRGPHSKNPNSRHCAVSPKDFSQFKENWKLLETTLQPPDTHPTAQHI
jgi:hypothetical protein